MPIDAAWAHLLSQLLLATYFQTIILTCNNIRFVDCRLGFEMNDDRPALVVDDAEDVTDKRSEFQKGADCLSRVGYRNVATAGRNP